MQRCYNSVIVARMFLSSHASVSRWAGTRFAPPSRSQRARELRAAIEPVRLIAATGRLRAAPTGSAAPMVVFPGLGAGDGALALLRRYLRDRDHRPRGWGLGTNRGNPSAVLDDCLALVRSLADTSGRRVNLVGWSLGGILARELARDHGELVDRVATFGTPIYGPRFTAARSAYSDEQLAVIESEIDVRYRRPLERPLLAVHSRNDGIVDWRSCVDHLTPGARNVEVSSSHLAMGVDPDVWLHLAAWFAD